MKMKKTNLRCVVICSVVLCFALLVGCDSSSEDGYDPGEWAAPEEEEAVDEEDGAPMEGLDPCDEEGVPIAEVILEEVFGEEVASEDVVEVEIIVDADEETPYDEEGVPIEEVVEEEVPSEEAAEEEEAAEVEVSSEEVAEEEPLAEEDVEEEASQEAAEEAFPSVEDAEVEVPIMVEEIPCEEPEAP